MSKPYLLLKNNWPKTFIDNKNANFNFLEKIQYLYMKTSGLVENIKFINNLTKNVKFIKNFNVNKVINCDNGFKKIIDNKGNEFRNAPSTYSLAASPRSLL